MCNGGVMCNDDAGRGSRRDVTVRRRGGQKAEGNKTVPVHSLISASPTDPCSRIGGSRDEGQSCATLTPHATLRLSAGALGYFPAALFFPHDVGKCGGANPRAPPQAPCDPLRSGVARACACENRLRGLIWLNDDGLLAEARKIDVQYGLGHPRRPEDDQGRG